MNVRMAARRFIRSSWRRRGALAATATTAAFVTCIADAGLSADSEVVVRRGAPTAAPIDDDVRVRLEEGVFLYGQTRATALLQSEFSERYEGLAQPRQIALYESERRYDDLFLAGDDLFIFEFDRFFGGGRGGVPFVPVAPQPVHEGERGGMDGASCRACHFVGGPDGAGTSTQRALFRGDGTHISSASVRDAPHLMGLGAVQKLAREMEADLEVIHQQALDAAATTSEAVPFPLVTKGVSFGELVARPGGVVDTSGIEGISSDLRVRPFGHKGRHANLVELADEALQVHHGVQSASYLERHRAEGLWVGDGPDTDPDEDGVEVFAVWRDDVAGAEASAAQALLLAGYMTLIGVPEIHPPHAPDLLQRWVKGRALLSDVGCTSCHVEQLIMDDDLVVQSAVMAPEMVLTLPLREAARDPKPVRTDFSPGSSTDPGTPIFLYSDLKRHDLGPDLADAVDESLPHSELAVDKAVWLTRTLWGLAETGPYLHDGRAATLHDAILAHGGEAAQSRDAYLELDAEEQADLRIFLTSLSRGETVLVE